MGAGLYLPCHIGIPRLGSPPLTACACCFCSLIQVVVETASKILTLVDLAGHAKYLKTTVRLGVRASLARAFVGVPARARVFVRVRGCMCIYVRVCV
jgi:hypothetical protein